MVPKNNHKISKGMLFAGCSFTWGQGLYYYSNLPTLREPLPDHYDQKLVKTSHLKFMKTVRYPRLVANHFQTWEVVHHQNGGSNEGATEWWTRAFTNQDTNKSYIPEKIYEFDEFSIAVFQLTQSHRNHLVLTHKGIRYNMPYHEYTKDEYKNIFIDWLIENNIDHENWLREHTQKNIDNVKEFLQLLEKNNIKTYIMAWPAEYVEFINKDSWLKERFITLNYKSNTYDSIEQLIRTNRELEIKHDYENFATTPQDHHPSLGCHKIMAESIIERIEKNIR
jgi:hypothetical protein